MFHGHSWRRAQGVRRSVVLIATNFARFPQSWKAANGLSGTATATRSPREFWAKRGPETVWLVNCNTTLTLELGALKTVAPGAASLMAVDLVLRAPSTPAARALLPLKRFLFGKVDHFIHYFRDLSGFERTFGIGPGRSSFVPFKVNFADRFALEAASEEGDYVLCVGRSLRDYDTFFDAIQQLPYPAAIPAPDPVLLAQHGARFTRALDALPQNVRMLEDDGSDESLIRILSAAKLVVIPVLKTNMVASGISSALNSMILGKCVIGSEGPGMSDVFTQEVLTAAPENPAALAAVIRRAWEDSELRRRTAEAGLRYARSAGGEPELYQRVIDQVAAWFSNRPASVTKR